MKKIVPITFVCRTCEYLTKQDGRERQTVFDTFTEAWQHVFETQPDASHTVEAGLRMVEGPVGQ